MNKTRKILFFDIDGTLITDDGKRYFPDSAKEAIQKARENGHLVDNPASDVQKSISGRS